MQCERGEGFPLLNEEIMKNINMQLSYAPAEISFSYCGEGNVPAREMNSLLKRQLCLLCYDEAQTVEALAKALQCNKSYVIDAVKTLCDLGMMKKVGDVYEAFLTCFPMFHDDLGSKTYKLVYDYVIENEVPEKINTAIKNVENQIKTLDFYGNDLELEYLNWFLYKITSDLISKKLTSYYADKTEEFLLDNKYWRTEKRNFSLRGLYRYADEKEEPELDQKCWHNYSTFYNRVANCHVCNVFDAEPFPYAWGKDGFDWEGGRNRYLWDDNLDLYFKIVYQPELEFFKNPSEEVKKLLDGFVEHGVAVKNGDNYKGLVPVFSQEVFNQLENLIRREITPIAKEIAENCGSQVEKLLVPTMKGVKEREDQFYVYWFSQFLDPLCELIWYGMNVEGLKIPEDYKKSAAGIYILKDE